SKTNGTYTNSNTFTIASGKTLTLNGGIGSNNPVFNQNSGILDAAGAFRESLATFSFNGGTITGSPELIASTLNIGSGSTGAAAFTIRGGGSKLSGDIAAGQTLLVERKSVG